MSTEFLRGYLSKAWPEARVHHYPDRPAVCVMVDVTLKELVAMRNDPQTGLCAFVDKLNPRPVRPRRLHWGKRK